MMVYVESQFHDYRRGLRHHRLDGILMRMVGGLAVARIAWRHTWKVSRMITVQCSSGFPEVGTLVAFLSLWNLLSYGGADKSSLGSLVGCKYLASFVNR